MLKFHKTMKSALAGRENLIFIASESHVKKGLHRGLLPESVFETLQPELKKAQAGRSGKLLASYTTDKKLRRASFAILPDKVSRGNTPTRKEWIYKHSAGLEKHDKSVVVVVLDQDEHYPAAASALARRLRLFSKKSSSGKKPRSISVVAVNSKGTVIPASKDTEAAANGVAWACQAVDTPPSDLNPKAFSTQIKSLFKGQSQVTSKEIAGSKLLDEKLGGIHAVGKAAEDAPRMLILDYKPSKSPAKTVALIGKGVTYDTGGLSLKIQGNMVGMKSDMGGAAAVVGAFKALVESKAKQRVIAILGLVENAIGPKSYKNDDIITMHSGKTVEINNTDAEGRLVLADCVSYACRKYQPDLVVDAATLTGAQMVATGLLHAAVISNDHEMEQLALRAGQESGDLVAALPFAPEFFKSEFESQVADMKNSVKNRMNAQSSCAAQFIYNHIEDTDVPWLHVDLAGPSFAQGRGTGYGVGLLAHITRQI